MVSLADFQPLSITKINVFLRQMRFYRAIFQCQSPFTNNDLLIRCVTVPVSVDSNIVLNIMLKRNS